MLQLLRAVQKVIGVCLGHDLPVIVLLHKVLIALFLSKVDGVFLTFEIDMRALEIICGGLPSHQWILPPVASLKNVPVHPPVVPVPIA